MAAPASKGTPGTTVTDGTGKIIGRYDAQGNYIPTSGGGAGSATSGTTSTPAGGTPVTVPGGSQQNMGGFAARYAPGVLQDMVYDSPETILYDLFQEMGLGGSQGSGLYQTLADFGGADPLSLYMLQTGADQGALGGMDAENYTNWLAAQYQNQGTAGGGAFDFQGLMGNVFGMAPGDENTSPLYNLLTAGTATQQVSNLYNMARDAGRVGLNPLAQSAMLTSLQRAAQGYQSQSMQGLSGDAASDPFFAYLGQQNPGLVSSLTGR